ncbi:MAG: crotonase/enoyl-CoA hydratase family protein [Boseongicola sp.]|nr:crotonase/enoyl-CoA hydratase family protein [Boseongicola sp.]
MSVVGFEEDARGVAQVTLRRPEKRNAMSGEMIAELAAVAEQIAESSSIRVVVLAADGDVFCAGGDLNWMRAQMEADGATRRREATSLAMMLKSFNELGVPLIGRVHGDAFGGGVGLMSVCDVVVASKSAKFGLTETRLGLIPATIGPYVVARMGEARARRVFFSSRAFEAEEAVELGLVSRVVESTDLDAAIERELTPYFACAPKAVAEAKALVRSFGPSIDEAAISASVEALVKRWESDEADEGTAAFFDRRPARWMR